MSMYIQNKIRTLISEILLIGYPVIPIIQIIQLTVVTVVTTDDQDQKSADPEDNAGIGSKEDVTGEIVADFHILIFANIKTNALIISIVGSCTIASKSLF